MSKKLFLITEFHSSSQNSTGYLIEKLYQALLREKDFETVLMTKKTEVSENNPGIIYVQQKDYDKSRLTERIWHELSLNAKFFFKALRNISNHDVVVTGTNPTLLLFIVYLLKKHIGFNWVLLVHDVFPESLVASKTLKDKSLVYKAAKCVFDKIYSSPNKVITIGKDMQQLINRKANRDDAEVVPNWIDIDDIEVHSKDDNPILKELNLNSSDKVIFNFFGNIGRVQGVDKLIQAINLMSESKSSEFIFIGNGAYVDKLRDLIKHSSKENIHYYGSVEQAKKSIGLNACDISIVTLAEGMLGLGVPSKAYYSMAANKPLFCIMDEDSEIATMVRDNEIGWSVEPKHPQDIAHALDQVVKSFNNSNGASPREVLIKKYSDKVSIDQVINIIRSCI